jgi:hypothetical protein
MAKIRMRLKAMLPRLVAILGAAALGVVAGGGAAQAATTVEVDAGWQSFITGGGVGGGTIAGPYEFSSATLTKVTVTDAFCHGDEFHVFDNGDLLGDTSEIAPEDHTCPFQLFFPADARADAAILDPTFSQGVFFVSPGKHSLDFVNKVMWNDVSTGTGAYFRLDSVTLSKDDCKGGAWETYASVFENQGECVSFVMS